GMWRGAEATKSGRHSSGTAMCKRFGWNLTKRRRAAGAGKVCANYSFIRQRHQSLPKWNRTRRLRRPGYVQETSFGDSIKHRSTIQSRYWNTSANIQMMSLFFTWSELARG